MTREETIDNHKRMWLWIANETKKRRKKVTKEDFFKEHSIEIPFCACFLCDYAVQESNSFGKEKCNSCPLDWGIYFCTSETQDSLYDKWYIENDYQKCAELAEEIANLKENENKDED